MNNKTRINLMVAGFFAINIIILTGVILLLVYWGDDPEEEVAEPVTAIQPVKSKSWKITDTVPVLGTTSRALAVTSNGSLLVGDDNGISAYYMNGEKLTAIPLKGGVVSMAVDKGIIYAAQSRQIFVVNGSETKKWIEFDSRTRITAMVISHGLLFVADAGNRKVFCYDLKGKKLWETSGSGEDKFIIPSPYFDLVPDGYGGVWVVNPGRHRIENYSAEGKFKALWKPLDQKTFMGCCNPAYLGILSGDRFVTLEKGKVRSRLFAPSGSLIDYVAPEGDFSNGPFQYDLAVLPDNRVAILDGHGGKINIFSQE